MELTKFSQLKNIIDFCNAESIDFKEVINQINSDECDFGVGNYRFISESEIDEIQCYELKSDTYFLGGFNADFLSDIINVPYKAIVALQKADCYSELGEICEDYISEIQQEYSRLDGYGHHFAQYDSETLEDLLFCGYYVFRTN
jgi:hypothetical protein